MVTDDERRRVAAALREYASFDCECEDDEDCLVDCADWGERVLNLLDCGASECECYAALADLIDPDTTSDTTKRDPDTTKCDREALLAIEENMFEDAVGLAMIAELEGSSELQDLQSTMAGALMDYARRIREACGEVDS